MVPAAHRMRASRDFARAVRRGRRSGRRGLVGYLADRAGKSEDGVGAGTARVGFVVGRGVGNAVERNRVKRRLRHLMRNRLDRLPLGGLLVLRAQAELTTLSSQQLAGTLDETLDRLLVARTGGRAGRDGFG